MTVPIEKNSYALVRILLSADDTIPLTGPVSRCRGTVAGQEMTLPRHAFEIFYRRLRMRHNFRPPASLVVAPESA